MARTDTHGENSLTMAGEDYLESISRIMTERGIDPEVGVRSVDVAEDLKVSKASVSKALTYLKENGMVEQERYGRVVLTPEGMAYARDVWRRHRTLRKFLIDLLGVDAERADEEACLVEHAFSIDTMDRMYNYLADNGIIVES